MVADDGRKGDDAQHLTVAEQPVPAADADAGDSVDAQSEQSFPASDPPSWSGLSTLAAGARRVAR